MFVDILIICLCVSLVTCHEHHQSAWAQPVPGTTPTFGCIAVVTGFPEIDKLKSLVSRLLTQLLNDFHVDASSIHVFCQGECSNAFPEYPVQYHRLNNTIDREKYRGFIIARNYKLMFIELFKKMEDVDYCMILEDDLVLAPDSIAYMEAGIRLMKRDTSIFTVSLYNDNSYPWCASNTTFFRRIDHFSGLGFMMSRNWYLELVKDNWDEEKVWDHNLQTIMATNKMASIQPEVNRVLHSPDQRITTTAETRPIYNKYLSQITSYSASVTNYNLIHLQKDLYDISVKGFIKHSTEILYLYDAAFYDQETPLLYICSDRASLNSLLRFHGLSGAGLGNMIRGTYQDTVYIRIFGHLVLIMSEHSPFWKTVPRFCPVDPFDAMKSKYQADMKNVERNLRGLLYHISQAYDIVIAASSSDTNCMSVCATRDQQCTRTGLWLLNMDCTVLQKLVVKCTSCQTETSGRSESIVPSLSKEGRCSLGYSYRLTCDDVKVTEGSYQICPCQ